MRSLCAALVLLLALPASAQDLGSLFHKGMKAVEAAGAIEGERRDELLDQAIAAFHEMLVADPGLVRVRLELARAFFLKGEDRLARRHFEQVLAGGVPPAVAGNVNRYLAQIRARKRWSARFGFALAPDTNLGASSDQRIIYIYGLPFERDAEDLATSGIGLSVWTGGEYQYPLSQRWRIRAGADASRREHEGSIFDQAFVSAYAGPRWLIGRNTEASLLPSVQRRWSGGAPDYDAFGGRLEAGHRFTGRLTANGTASLHERRYRTRDHLDGPVLDLTVGGAWVVTPTVRAEAALGWGRERPETERWRHEKRWVQTGVTVALPKGFNVDVRGRLSRTDYEGNWFPHTAGEPREDRTRTVRLSAHNRALAWKGFSPQVSVVREERATNAQLYDYERTGGELRFVRVF